jgi:UrcA family protein
MNKLVFAAAALAATAVLPAAALAGAPEQPRQASVFYGDLDLSKPAGGSTFKARLKGAAARVCRNDDQALSARLSARACRHQAVETATSALPQAQLRAMQSADQAKG